MTLPHWARQHPIVRNVMIAFEYHKPGTDIREKEMALNLACSFLRPIDERLADVIAEVASSTKVRLNIEVGKTMMNEVRFHKMDHMLLGTDSEDEVDNEEDRDKQLTRLLSQGIDDEDGVAEADIMQNVL
mmetsp:Transcript_40655/g.29282  ORF Transcript_40655/g.29282 Transcript_40655/m.29282 type:complete len:130 (+) Transcript_40655:1564-1953(+)